MTAYERINASYQAVLTKRIEELQRRLTEANEAGRQLRDQLTEAKKKVQLLEQALADQRVPEYLLEKVKLSRGAPVKHPTERQVTIIKEAWLEDHSVNHVVRALKKKRVGVCSSTAKRWIHDLGLFASPDYLPPSRW